jgi:hypothetical protein
VVAEELKAELFMGADEQAELLERRTWTAIETYTCSDGDVRLGRGTFSGELQGKERGG